MIRSFFASRVLFSLSLLGVLLLGAASAADAQTGLKGRVRTNSGKGIANATVSVSRDGKVVKSSRSTSNGGFEITGIEPGVYGLRVEADGYAAGSMSNIEVKRNKVRDLGDRLFLNADEGTQVIIRGSVFFKEGTSVGGAVVELARVNSDGTVKSIAKYTTSVSGEFAFRRPDEPATYRITAKYGGVSGSKDITVENAALYRLAISLDLSRNDR